MRVKEVSLSKKLKCEDLDRLIRATAMELAKHKELLLPWSSLHPCIMHEVVIYKKRDDGATPVAWHRLRHSLSAHC